MLLNYIFLTRYATNLISNCGLEDVRDSVNLPLSKKHFYVAVYYFVVFDLCPVAQQVPLPLIPMQRACLFFLQGE